jgi:hypothetical protein
MALHRTDAGQEIVAPQPDVQHPGPELGAPIERVDEPHGPDEVRREPTEPLALARRLPDELHVPLLQVPEPAVDQLGRAARGSGSEVPLLHDCDLEPPQHRVAGNARPVYAAAHHEQIELLAAEGRQGICAPVGAIVALHQRATYT